MGDLSRDRRLLSSGPDRWLSLVNTSTHRGQTRLLGGPAMESHAYAKAPRHPQRASVVTTRVVRMGARPDISAGLIMAAWQMIVAAIAQNPTAVPGIHQT